MEIADFVYEVISIKNKSITDEIFLLIQNDKALMQQYLKLVQEKKLDVVNRQIGKMIKVHYNLSNDKSRNESPKSTLISSHQEFE